MNNAAGSKGHPGEEMLLRYTDGELPAREQTEVRDHLNGCWQCRASLEELEQVIAGCVRHHQTISDHFPSPPAPWCDIYRGMSKVDAALGSNSFFQSVREWFASRVVRPVRWVPALAGVAAVAVIVHQLTNAPSARAAELLRKAVAASESRPKQPHRIEIRARGRNLTRMVSAPLPARNVADAAALSEVQSMFRTAHYNWDDPLSAASFSEWHSHLDSKSDEVRSDPANYEIRTAAAHSEITFATLKLRQADLQAVESTLRFRNDDLIEIRDLTPDPVLSSSTAAAVEAAPPVVGPPSSKSKEFPAVSQAGGTMPVTAGVSAKDELEVWTALHRLGADLGEPVEVSREADRIVVRGVGIPAARQRQIEQELASNSRVKVQFAEPSSAEPATQGRPVTAPSVDPAVAKLQEKIERYIGGRASFDQFSDGVLRDSETLLSHAHALRRLAEHFPSESESQLSADQRHLLRSLCQEHADALWQEIAVLQGRMNPVLGALGATTPGAKSVSTAAPTNAASWQQATAELLLQARHADSLLAVMLLGATGDAGVDRLPDDLNETLAALKAQIASYRARAQ